MVEVEVLMPRKDEQKGVALLSFSTLITLVTLEHSNAGKFLSTRLSSLRGEAWIRVANRGRSPWRTTLFKYMMSLGDRKSVVSDGVLERQMA